MPLAQVLADFRTSTRDCYDLLAFAHRTDPGGGYLALPRQREQIIIAAFLNYFLAWETFLESSFLDYLVGEPTIVGVHPHRLALPPDREHALGMLIGTQRFFDFGNHDFALKMTKLFFQAGGPIGTYLPSVFQALADMRTMRNASAHITTTTQVALDSLAQRCLGASAVLPCLLCDFIMTQHPSEPTGVTVFMHYQQIIDVAAELIANG